MQQKNLLPTLEWQNKQYNNSKSKKSEKINNQFFMIPKHKYKNKLDDYKSDQTFFHMHQQ